MPSSIRRKFLVKPLLVALLALLAVAALAIFLKDRPKHLPTYQVKPQPIVQTVVATGQISPVSRVQVGSAITATLLERRVQEGDQVSAGDILAILENQDQSAQVRQARAALQELQTSQRPQAQLAAAQAQSTWQQAQRELERRRALFESRAITREELEKAQEAEEQAKLVMQKNLLLAKTLSAGEAQEEAAKARLASAEAALSKTVIRAEINGRVLTRNAEPGDLVQAGRTLFEIARADEVEVIVALEEQNLGALALGQSAQCIADAYPQEPFSARVSFIAPSIDPQRGTVEVRLNIEAPTPEFLRHDMTVSVNIRTGQDEAAIVVPNTAISSDMSNEASVWVAEDERGTKAVRRKVQLGLRGLAQTQVLQGLESGEWVLMNHPNLRDH